MDLSSGPRTSTSVNEVQDFSMPFKNKPTQNVTQTQTSSTPPKSKLDDMLNKLMQKKNCVRTSRVSHKLSVLTTYFSFNKHLILFYSHLMNQLLGKK